MFERLKDRFAVWLVYRDTVARLRRLDRSTLHDIGIDPAAIKARARAAVRHLAD